MFERSTANDHQTIDIPVSDLKSFVNDFPALLWRIEITRSRIQFLNDHSLGTLGDGARLFMKNMEFRKQILLPEDAHLLEGFMESVKEGKTASTVFRVRDRGGRLVWLKLTGATNSYDPRFYYGYLLDVSDTVQVIQSILDQDVQPHMMIEDTDVPSLLVDVDDGTVITANSAAEKLFGRTRGGLKQEDISDLITDSTSLAAKRIREDLPFSRKWTGKLDYLTRGGVATSETVVRYLVHDGRKMLRLMLLQPELVRQVTAGDESYDQARCAVEQAIQGEEDISAILRAALRSPMIDGEYDGVMFSDVQARKNKVMVYGAGEPFDAMPQGENFSYKGTIAEDIERYDLKHLIVDDTQDSIKPIDWALFLPCGIRSYFAKPYHVRGVLRTVLIICSTEPRRFSGKPSGAFNALFEPLAEAAKDWRRRKRRAR